MSNRTAKAAAWLLAGGGLLLVAVANWHLVAVAVSSQPACVDHVRQGEGSAVRGEYSAADSACSPARERRHNEGTP
jgi:hypothetical protein